MYYMHDYCTVYIHDLSAVTDTVTVTVSVTVTVTSAKPIKRKILTHFYVPASYIMYLSDFCRFLLCTCRWERRGERGSWEGGG